MLSGIFLIAPRQSRKQPSNCIVQHQQQTDNRRRKSRLPQRSTNRKLLTPNSCCRSDGDTDHKSKHQYRVNVLKHPHLNNLPGRILRMLGMDNYQGIAFAQLFNNPAAEGDLAGVFVNTAFPVTSEYPESPELTARWLEQAKAFYQKPNKPGAPIPPQLIVVDSIDELLAKCDCVIMAGLDGRQHLAQATAVLNAGKPLFITRPVASSIDDAAKIFALAKQTGTPCWSSSQHRFSPGFSGMRNHPDVGKVIGVDVYGGYEANRPDSDSLILPLHSIEALYAMIGNRGVQTVSCTETPSAVTATLLWKDGRIGNYRGIRQGAVKYSATVFGDTGVSIAGIYGHGIPVAGVAPTNDKYMGYEGIAIEIAKAFKNRTIPVAHEETLEIFAVCKAMQLSAAQNGNRIQISEILAGIKP